MGDWDASFLSPRHSRNGLRPEYKGILQRETSFVPWESGQKAPWFFSKKTKVGAPGRTRTCAPGSGDRCSIP